MEGSEESAKNDYASYDEYPDLQQIARDEDEHEQRLIALINEERLEYMGSVVLGLNDALVEFTGALAGFTLALSDSRLIALTGSITGIAAALSMLPPNIYLPSPRVEMKTGNILLRHRSIRE